MSTDMPLAPFLQHAAGLRGAHWVLEKCNQVVRFGPPPTAV